MNTLDKINELLNEMNETAEGIEKFLTTVERVKFLIDKYNKEV